MDTHTPAQIFVADQRGYLETGSYRRFHTFNFEAYAAEGREPFGLLYLLNNETVSPQASLSVTVGQASTVILLPLMGGLAYQTGEAEQFLEPGQAGTLSLTAGQSYTVANPYETEAITLLHIGWQQSDKGAANQTIAFDLTQKNRLLPFSGPALANASGYIGLFDGRAEGTYAVEPTDNEQLVFVHVLQGAFEVANRLMHTGDGLALRYQQADVLEFEALSNNALLVVLVQ